MPLERTISLVHHVEHIMAVPYRFVKAFQVRIRVESGSLEEKEFYLKVLDRGQEIKRDRNVSIMTVIRSRGLVRRSALGASFVESILMKDFVDTTSELMAADPYIWLAERPRELPYERFS